MSRVCKECNIEKDLVCFEVTTKDGASRRTVCKPCYARRKKERASMSQASIDKSAVPKPSACISCGRSPANGAEFSWRSDIARGGWTATCKACLNQRQYSKTWREKKRAEDEDAYLQRNAEAMRKWRQPKNESEMP